MSLDLESPESRLGPKPTFTVRSSFPLIDSINCWTNVDTKYTGIGPNAVVSCTRRQRPLLVLPVVRGSVCLDIFRGRNVGISEFGKWDSPAREMIRIGD
jgi:hypothetical protein